MASIYIQSLFTDTSTSLKSVGELSRQVGTVNGLPNLFSQPFDYISLVQRILRGLDGQSQGENIRSNECELIFHLGKCNRVAQRLVDIFKFVAGPLEGDTSRLDLYRTVAPRQDRDGVEAVMIELLKYAKQAGEARDGIVTEDLSKDLDRAIEDLSKLLPREANGGGGYYMYGGREMNNYSGSGDVNVNRKSGTQYIAKHMAFTPQAGYGPGK